jgi:putative ABC transport system permease protein
MGNGAGETTYRRDALWGTGVLIVQRRLARHWRGLVAAGLLLGIGFGVCFASLAAARRTDSAFPRILVEAEAPDAAVALGLPPLQAERSLREVDGVTDVRVYAGFLGRADEIDPIASAALIVPIRDRFPIMLPKLSAGRLPDPDAAEEVFLNTSTAERNGLEVGHRLHFRLVDPESSVTTDSEVTIVGIGTLPSEAVADETLVVNLVVFTRAFYEAHRDLADYTAASLDLAPGVDAARDLGAALGARGHELQSVSGQEQQAVDEALRPLIIVLVALGALTFGVTAVAAGQVLQRNRGRWRHDDAGLLVLGATRGQVRAVELAISGVIAGLAVAAALLTMLIASPVAPLGPLHDLDPAQGFGIDWAVAAAGACTLVATIMALTLLLSSTRRKVTRPAITPSPRITATLRSPVAAAGVALALHAQDGRGRVWRESAATVAAAAVVAVCGVFVASAVALTAHSANYGFDADLVALNAYGDQAAEDLEEAFGDRDDVAAATGFTSGSFLVDGYAVPGLAATFVKGELGPTVLRGRLPRAVDQIALGQDTLDHVAAEVGDLVPVQVFAATADGEPAGDAADLRIVGVLTFPAVNQIGTDMPRLGVGALVTRGAFRQMSGETTNDPEFTTVRLVEGTDPSAVIADNLRGFQDAARTTTSWFTDTKPAELRQLDAAMPYLRGTTFVAFAILLAVVGHALWTRARASRRECAALRAVGFTGGQLDGVTLVQAVPIASFALLLGVPIGIVAGRRVYTRFAQSLAVVAETSTSVTLLIGVTGAVLLAVAAGGLLSVAVARRNRFAIRYADAGR